MIEHKRFLFGVLLCQIFVNVACIRSAHGSGPVLRECLGCICAGSSSCYMGSYRANGVHGPFRIQKGYWIDGGLPTVDGDSPTSPDAFENCAADRKCSAMAVQGYMEKYRTDCNNDGKINCDDYAAIHRFGPNACNQQLPPDFQKRYHRCKLIFQAEKNARF